MANRLMTKGGGKMNEFLEICLENWDNLSDEAHKIALAHAIGDIKILNEKNAYLEKELILLEKSVCTRTALV